MHPSGLGQFFDSLDEDIKFESWKNTIKGKLTHLKKTIPTENREALSYIDGCIL